MDKLKEYFDIAKNKNSDMFPYIPILCKFAQESCHITEMGIGPVQYELNSTWGLLYGLSLSSCASKTYIAYDIIDENYHILNAKEVATSEGIDLEFILANTIEIEIKNTDLLFIDTDHRYQHLTKELTLHSPKVSKFIILHDTSGKYENWEDWPYDHEFRGELKNYPEKYGMWPAVIDFLNDNKDWKLHQRFIEGNGLTILSRKT